MQDTLARRLRVLRAERSLTLRDAERLTGVDKDTLSKIERGARHPQDITLAKIAKGYEVPVEELLEEPALAGKAEGPLSLEWALKADLDLLRLVIRDAPSEQLREIGAALVADFYRVQTREELVEKDRVSRAPYVNAFARAGIISEELVRRGEDPLERHVLTLKRHQDVLRSGADRAAQEDDQEHQAG